MTFDEFPPREADLIAEIDNLRPENADLQDQRDALVLQITLASRELRKIADALDVSTQSLITQHIKR